jgi:hypothetical protein
MDGQWTNGWAVYWVVLTPGTVLVRLSVKNSEKFLFYYTLLVMHKYI